MLIIQNIKIIIKKNVLFYIIFLYLFSPNFLFSINKKKILAGIMKPEMIRIFDNELFIVERAKIYNYILDTLELKRIFGRKGEGPGELSVTPLFYNTIMIKSGQLLVNSFNKLVYFNRKGKLVMEIRKKSELKQIMPVGKNYLRLDQVYMEDKTQFQRLLLYNGSFSYIKELCRQKSGIQSIKKTNDLIPDSLGFRVWKDRIYIERSNIGFHIDVFSSNGTKLYEIKKKTKRLPVTEKYKKMAIKRFKNDPIVKEIGFNNFKKNIADIQIPDTFPEIQSIDLADDKIYIRTYKSKSNNEECIVMDLKGNIIKTRYLPIIDRASFMAYFLGVRFYTISNGKFYFIEENDDEIWELFVYDI